MKLGSMPPGEKITIKPELEAPLRIDTVLSNYFEAYSRSYFKKLLEQERISINNDYIKKPSYVVNPGDELIIHFPDAPTFYTDKEIDPNLKVEIIFSHPDFLILNKPPHLSVHAPKTDFKDVTLVDWLLNKYDDIKQVGAEDRPGIVHRLDKDTSGLIIIPRTNRSHRIFSDMFKNREIRKTYVAFVKGHPDKQGTIEFPISRDPNKPIKMTHSREDGKAATSHYKVITYFDNASLLELKPVTGRTHQLRVHCAAIGHPILGDGIYGTVSKNIKRQALHAKKLEFNYDGKSYIFEAPFPEDFQKLERFLAAQPKKNS